MYLKRSFSEGENLSKIIHLAQNTSLFSLQEDAKKGTQFLRYVPLVYISYNNNIGCFLNPNLKDINTLKQKVGMNIFLRTHTV